MAIELDNSFTVPVPPEQAWDVLLDVERIAPCMPGASVTSVEGDEIEGQVKVKLGPLSLTYKGTAKFTDKDQASHTISIEATGKETRGVGHRVGDRAGEADAGRPGAGQTLVSIHTSLNVTGKPGPVRSLPAARGERQAHPAVRHQPRGHDQRRHRAARTAAEAATGEATDAAESRRGHRRGPTRRRPPPPGPRRPPRWSSRKSR